MSDPGEPLFKPATWQNIPENDRVEADPVVLQMCHFMVIDKEDIPTQLDGVVAFMGTELTPEQASSVDPRDVYTHPRSGKKYRKLRLGDQVNKQQEIVLLDDIQAELEMKIADAGLNAARADVVAAIKTIGHVVALRDIAKLAYDKGAGSLQDLRAAEANVARYESEKIAKDAAVNKADGEFERAKLRLKYHLISPAISGEITMLHKEIGEGIKATEPLLQIQNFDRIRVEGYIDVQFTPMVKKGMEVEVEPTMPVAPLKTLSIHKSRPITALAVSSDPAHPLVLSGGEDGMVYVWDRAATKAQWPHKGTVRAIACTSRQSKESLALTGAEDGIARVWDLTKLNLDTPLRELNEKSGEEAARTFRHTNGVTAAAFSPDGEYCVTADGERNIFLWKTATGEKVYRFPTEHTSPVSCLHFTPQCRVVSAGRDNVVFVWKVGQKGAAVERTFEHRSGDVTQLGVTEDGNWIALDHDKTRLHIAQTGKGITERVLQSLGESTHFSNFALFSPPLNGLGNRLLLTASNQGRVLQLWRHAPTEDRTREILRLVPQNNVPATVAAFSPFAENGFVVVGTERGDVHLWPLPPESEVNRRWTARVTHLEPSVDPTGHSVKIWAQLDNGPPGPQRLRPGNTAAMVIRPTKAQ